MNPHGKMTQLFFWARILSKEEMTDFTGTCNFSVNFNGKTFTSQVCLFEIKSAKTTHFSDMYFDWNIVDISKINVRQMMILEDKLENTCMENRTSALLIAIPLR